MEGRRSKPKKSAKDLRKRSPSSKYASSESANSCHEAESSGNHHDAGRIQAKDQANAAHPDEDHPSTPPPTTTNRSTPGDNSILDSDPYEASVAHRPTMDYINLTVDHRHQPLVHPKAQLEPIAYNAGLEYQPCYSTGGTQWSLETNEALRRNFTSSTIANYNNDTLQLNRWTYQTSDSSLPVTENLVKRNWENGRDGLEAFNSDYVVDEQSEGPIWTSTRGFEKL